MTSSLCVAEYLVTKSENVCSSLGGNVHRDSLVVCLATTPGRQVLYKPGYVKSCLCVAKVFFNMLLFRALVRKPLAATVLRTISSQKAQRLCFIASAGYLSPFFQRPGAHRCGLFACRIGL